MRLVVASRDRAALTAVVANLYGVDGPMSDFWGPPSSLVWGENDFVLARNMGGGMPPEVPKALVELCGPRVETLPVKKMVKRGK